MGRGQAKANFNDETTVGLLKKTKSLIRGDWGGKDPLASITKRLIEDGATTEQSTPELAQFVFKLVLDQVEGSRKRVNARLDEAIRRLEENVGSSEPTEPAKAGLEARLVALEALLAANKPAAAVVVEEPAVVVVVEEPKQEASLVLVAPSEEDEGLADQEEDPDRLEASEEDDEEDSQEEQEQEDESEDEDSDE